MAGISRFPASMVRPLAPRRRAGPQRTGSTSAACQYGNPTFWIGVSMFCLVIVYVLIVVAVTRIHLNNTAAGGSGGMLSAQTTSNVHLEQQQQNQQPYVSNGNEKETLRERLEKAKISKIEAKAAAEAVARGKAAVAAVEVKEDGQSSEDTNSEENSKSEDENNNMKKQEEIKVETKKEKRAGHENSPLRKFHLEDPPNKGVVPEVLIHSGSSDTKGKHGLPLSAVRADELDPSALKSNDKEKLNITRDVVLKAYVESIDFVEWEIKPLPARSKAKADQLQIRTYPKLNSCSRFLEQFPVDDDTPSSEDPFLPWIHDVFPTFDGKFIQFIAQNKRRCKTGKNEQDIMMFMQPQVSLFQHVPVKRVNSKSSSSNETRYKLVPYEEADSDGMTTRFICRFKPTMQETLSVHNFDYDWTSYRKRYQNGFTKEDGGIKSIHTTQLIFKCPVPPELQKIIRSGASVKDDWATLFVDLIPIRTPPRYGNPTQFLAPWYSQFQSSHKLFQAKEEWGDHHVLPRIEDSGRWENIPICLPSLMAFEGQAEKEAAELAAQAEAQAVSESKSHPAPVKKHKLVSCLWASAGYTTRGNRFAVNDGQRRLLEWITHNKLIGFDHFYIYDNTAAFRDDISLEPIAQLFPGEITLINWPAKICNNNPNNVDSPGERSSQYAAEASCRLRFGPHVEWIGQFDIDEYLIPMGKHNTALSLLDKLDKEDTRIVAFGSWRAWPRWALIDTIEPIYDKTTCWSNDPCFDLRIPMNTTMLQAYNCDRQLPGQKNQQMPAEKQIYRADYVLQHFIHYSAATVLSDMNKTEYEAQGLRWSPRAFPDARQRFADEVTEGLMIHSKAVARQDTVAWERVCHMNASKLSYRKRGLCRLGIPWPHEENYQNHDYSKPNATKDGWAYNCYVNEKVENYYVPQLVKGMAERLELFTQKESQE